MRGIRRETDRTPEQAPPLLTEHIKNMVDAVSGDGEPPRDGGPPGEAAPRGTEAEAAWLRGKRDRALILTGFAGAFRRSELAALRMEHIDSRPDGLLVTVPESKTDQEGEGQLVAIRRIEESDPTFRTRLGRARSIKFLVSMAQHSKNSPVSVFHVQNNLTTSIK